MSLQKLRLLFWLMLLAASCSTGARAETVEGQLRTLTNHVPRIVRRLKANGRLESATRLSLALGLPVRDPKGLRQLVDAVSDPANPSYRHYLGTDEFTRQFGPTLEEYESLKSFARANHLTIAGTHPNRMVMDVDGYAGDIEKAFHVTLRTYQHPIKGRTFYSPDAEPSLPAEIPLEDIEGLDNYILPQPQGRHARLSANSVSDAFTGSGIYGYFMAFDLRAAYLPGVALQGSGQEVGLLEFDGYYPGDISIYEQSNHIIDLCII